MTLRTVSILEQLTAWLNVLCITINLAKSKSKMTILLIQSYVWSKPPPKLRHNAFQPREHVGVRGRISHVQAIGDESERISATVTTER